VVRTFKTLRALLAASISFAAITSCAAQTRDWTTHDYPADGFSISLPSDPQINLQKDAASNSQMRSYVIDLGQGQSALMIGVMHFGSRPTKTPDAILQDGKNGALAQSKTHLVREKKIALAAATGLDFEAENDTLHIRAQVFLIGNTAYQLVESYPIGKPFDHAPEFFDSFRLTSK
jgi:hypothetical protein